MLYRLIKNYILSLGFVKEAMAEATRAGSIDAFKKAREDLKETMIEDLDDKAEDMMEERLNTMLSTVDDRRIVTVDKRNGVILIGGKRAEDGRLANLKAEAEFLERSDIWGLLHETPKEVAHRQMFIHSESLDDLKKGKSMLYTLSQQKNIVDILKSYEPRK